MGINKKVIVHCAPSGVGTGANLGMLTVDFSIQNILKENGLLDKVKIRSAWSAYDESNGGKSAKLQNNFPLSIEYGLGLSEELNDGDTVLYWGDFQWGNDYQIQSTKRLLNRDSSLSLESADEKIRNQFMLKEHFERESGVEIMSYGTTLFQNRIEDTLNDDYFRNLKWLIERAGFIKFRDPFSASVCESIKGDFEQNYLGLDAALLNEKSELLGFEENEFAEQFEGNIGYFFGRSTKAFPLIRVGQFLKGLKAELNCKLINIPWASFSGKKLFSSPFKKYLNLLGGGENLRLNDSVKNTDVLKAVSKCKLVVTDTYHVAINAITLGAPVVMIPEFRPRRTRDANMGYVESWRDKRVLLFQANNLADMMVLPDLLRSSDYRNKKIKLIKAVIDDEDRIKAMYRPIHRKAASERKKIGELLVKTVG